MLLVAGGKGGAGYPAPTENASPAVSAGATAMGEETAVAEAPPVTGRTEKEENELYEFGYAYPAQAAAIPGLKALLDKRLVAAKSELVATSRTDKQEAAKDGFPYRPHSSEVTWQVVTDTPDFLSLSAELYDFTGGAHGMSNFDALVWDRRADVARAPTDLFASKDALRAAIQPAFCDALDKERAKRRGAPVERDSGQSFSECIDPVASTVILGSTNRRTFDRIGVLVGPYEAGPYAEGTYEVTLPVTGKVMAALKPQYRASFSEQR
jgi:hypothetical protein